MTHRGSRSSAAGAGQCSRGLPPQPDPQGGVYRQRYRMVIINPEAEHIVRAVMLARLLDEWAGIFLVVRTHVVRTPSVSRSDVSP